MNRWISGNTFRLLENGDDFFPRVFECIAAATHEVVLETFILFEDKVGNALHAALLQAAARGVAIDVTIDGFGSPDLSDRFIATLTQAGVRVHVFDPAPRVWGWRTNIFRRMHRKIVVIDGQRAFVGGINFSADHLLDYGPTAKQDYTVEIEGPVVAEIHEFVQKALAAGQRNAKASPATPPAAPLSSRPAKGAGEPDSPAVRQIPQGGAAAIFVTRDNRHHTTDIEHHYRIAIRAARERVVIANAYFFPGYRLLREMRRASRRGVDIRLILQGEADMPIVKTAATLLYPHLLKSGVRIYEYWERPLHGKVALSDSEWATVGSSNLDPLSLSLNLEANVIIKDPAFNAHLADRLEHLMAHSCRQVKAEDFEKPTAWQSLRNFLVFHLVRLYPSWAGWLPAHAPVITLAQAQESAGCTRGPVAGADHVSRADPA
jgi:cardiolipin synthase A/B